jgi:serine-type D-Ala-D-Ala carboxypeptidase/endopeptidase
MAGYESDLVFPPQAVQGAGAMYSTVNDLLKYLSANIGLIGTKLKDAMQESHLIRHPFNEIQPTFEDLSGYNTTGHEYIGSVWLSGTDLGRQVIWHNGGIDGYSSIVGFNPAKQIGVVML